jgi:hypothetical protein
VLAVPGDKPLRVATYIATPGAVDVGLKPYDWYLDLVAKGAEERGLPQDFIASIFAAAFDKDPDLGRKNRLEALALLSRLKQNGMTLKSRANVRIAGQRTVGDWARLRQSLIVDGNHTRWKTAFEGFFRERLQSRYFAPIEALKASKRMRGEGFAIVAIQCSLIEFLGATLEGKAYRFRRKGDPELGEFEYDRSKDMFVRFLQTATPFKAVFRSGDLAEDFYTGVRCGLLHEARTKNGWTIRAPLQQGRMVDANAKIIWRDDFQRSLEEFVDWYGSTLPKDALLQQAFIRKFDGLCDD